MSQPTRRNGASSSSKNNSSSDSMSPSTEALQSPPRSRPSPYLLLIYPIILAIGSLFSVLSPSASSPAYSAPLSPGVASDIHTLRTPETISYFAGKQNILNLYFVKVGWFWTTLAFILLQLTTKPNSAQQPQRPSSRPNNHLYNPFVQSLLRYSLITLSWIITTQWFFGPALIDRSFTSTGGHCVPRSTTSPTNPLSGTSTSTSPTAIDLSTINTGLSCKIHGGRWLGGHDISGHFFLLVLSSAFLFLEFFISESQQLSRSSSSSQTPNISASAAAQIARDTTEEEKRAVGGWDNADEEDTTSIDYKARLWTSYFVWGVIVLDGWMLLMTAIWFHTLFEKVSGLALAAGSVWAVYFLPRLVPGWRSIVGGV